MRHNPYTLSSSGLKSFMTGMLLGDSKIEKNGQCFVIRQINEDLVTFKRNTLLACFKEDECSWKTWPAYFDGQWHHQAIFEVRVKNEYCKKLRARFYDETGRKFLTKETLMTLDTLGLAMWFADDGTTALIGKKSGKIKNRRVMLCTERYTYAEHEIMQQYFRLYWGLETRIVDRNNGPEQKERRWRLQFTTESAQEFLTLVGSYFVEHYPSLLYKLDMGYLDKGRTVTTAYWQFFQDSVKTHEAYTPRV